MKLNQSEITLMYTSIFIVKVFKWKKCIAINDELIPKINSTLLSSFGLAKSFNYVRDSKVYWSESTKSLHEQLEELNSYSRNDVEWKIEGEKILPESLNLAKLAKSSFHNGLRFKFVEKVAGDFVAAISFQSIDGKLNLYKIFPVQNYFRYI